MHYSAKSYIKKLVAIRKRIALLLLATVISSASITTLIVPRASAAELVDSSAPAIATTYTWKDRQSISVSGGSVKPNQIINVDANDNDPDTGYGDILMTQPIKTKDCALWVFCSETDTTWECTQPILIRFSNQLKQGTIQASDASSGGIGAANTTYCTGKAAAAYNGKVVSISGTRPGDGSGTAETDDQKRTSFVVKSNFTFADAPASVTIAITGAESKSVNATKKQTSTGASFEGRTTLGPGNYQADITSPPAGLTVAKESFEKVKFESLIVYMGDSEGYSNRLVTLELEINTLDPSARTYGPLPVTLYNSDGEEVASGETNSITSEPVTDGAVNERQFYLRYSFTDVEAGNYKVCIRTDKDLCEDIEKVEGEQKKVYFESTGDALLGESDIEKETSCAIDFIGWMVCGIMRAAASFNDITYGVVEGILLTAPLNMYQPDGVTPTPQYAVWRTIRDIANVLLVVVFLIIIFSQATSIAISNYGIKKMLPRLIIAAVAINVSYFAMMLAVDLANLIGVGLHNFVGGVADEAFNSAGVSWTSVVDEILSGTIAAGVAAGVAGLVISSGAFSASALGLLALPFIVGAVLAVIAAFVTLFVRNALIIVLVIISPLAFAAYLLPNTESLFTRWRKALTSMLLLFPTAALLFAGSKLAAYVIMGSRTGLELFFALVIMTLPLFMLPWLAQQGGNMLKLVGDRLQKLASSAKSPLQKALKPYVENQQEKYRSGRGGFFTPPGRSRTLDKDGNRLDKDGNIIRDRKGNPKKNFAQRWINTRKDMEQQTKNDSERVGLNWQQRAIDNPTGKTAQVIADKEDLHARSATQEKELKLHEAHRIATPGTFARAYADRGADADSEKKDLDEVEKRRQLERIRSGEASSISGESLADISRRTRTNQEKTKDSELKLEKQNIRDNRELDAAIVSQKASQRTISAIEARQQRDSDRNAAIAGTEEYIAEQDKAFFVEQSEGSTATTKSMIKEASQADATQQAARDERFEAEQNIERVDLENKNVQEARLGEGGDLQPLANRKFEAQERSELIGQKNKNVQEARMKEGGDLSGLADEKLKAEKEGELIKTQQEAEDEAQLAPEGELAGLQADIDKAKAEKDVATTLQAEEVQRRKGVGEDLQELSDKKAASEALTQGYRDLDSARIAAGKIADPNVKVAGLSDENQEKLEQAGRYSAIGKTAQGKATGAETLARSKEIEKDPQGSLARAMAAVDESTLPPGTPSESVVQGISGSTGRVVGQASKDVLEDIRGDIAVTKEDYDHAGVDNEGALRGVGIDRWGRELPEDQVYVAGTDGKKIREVGKVDFIDRAALVERVAGEGDYGANLAMLKYVIKESQLAEQARQEADAAETLLDYTDPASPEYEGRRLDAEAKRSEAKKRTQEALVYSRAVAQSKALAPYLGAEDISALKAGKLVKELTTMELESAKKGKITIPKLQSFDKDHHIELAQTIASTFGGKTVDDVRAMGYSEEEIAKLQQFIHNIDKFQDDPEFEGTHKPEVLDSLDLMRDTLTQAVGLGADKDTGEPYYRPDYVAKGQYRIDPTDPSGKKRARKEVAPRTGFRTNAFAPPPPMAGSRGSAGP